ncbi:radical SAM protein [Photobacterium damselae]|uniref:radical SAM protein n=1 Tax=Photobacterium damselae TaxID=38293 RepID=UPI001F4023D5|nr:radical SAM protein [Photobacterium damselae]UKA04689.1 hypothetical protein IHC89_24015 [Photobacterium damselae subsp. damselae]
MDIEEMGDNYLVFVRLIEACNLKCKHCLIPANPKCMTLLDCYNIPDRLVAHIPIGSQVTIKWHGGEPTLFGAKRLRKVMDILIADGRYQFRFEMRTNLMRLDSEWVDIFKTYFEGNIGVSWDFEIRETTNDEDFSSVFFKNLAVLAENGVTAYLAVTVTKPFLSWYNSHVLDIVDWVSRYKIGGLVFLRLIKTGRAKENWENLGVTNKEFSEFVVETHKLQQILSNAKGFDGVYPITEYFDVLKSSTDSGFKTQGCFSGWCDSNTMLLDEIGVKRGCLTMELQHVETESDLYKITLEDIKNARYERTRSCHKCPHKTYCNSGCISASRFDISGECSGGRIVFDYIKNRIDEK